MKSWHWKISTGPHHNTAQIQHCPISTTYHMWEDCQDFIIYPHIKFWWYRTMLNFCGIVAVILKMATSRNFSMSGHHYFPMSGIKSRHHNKFNIVRFQRHFICGLDYDVPKWFLTSKNFYWSTFSKSPPQYRTNSTLFDFNVLNWFPTLKNFYRSKKFPWLR
jgi:hypothetical protein